MNPKEGSFMWLRVPSLRWSHRVTVEGGEWVRPVLSKAVLWVSAQQTNLKVLLEAGFPGTFLTSVIKCLLCHFVLRDPSEGEASGRTDPSR